MEKNPVSEKIDSDNRRSPYPYHTLPKCIDVAAAVRDAGGSDVHKSMVAHQLNMSETTANFMQLIGSAKCFGLIEGRGSYSLSAASRRFFNPANETEKRLAFLTFLKTPLVFEKLIARFDGSKLPNNDLLATVLHKEHNITESWRPRIASMFLSAVREADVVDGNGFLRYESSVRAASRAEDLQPAASLAPPASTTPQVYADLSIHNRGMPVFQKPTETNVWSFQLGDSFVRLETSRNMSPALWAKLEQYISVLKPVDVTTEE
jgi:hypothetical protein